MTLPGPDLTDVYLTVEALAESWSWLALLLEPGPSTRPARPVTDAQRARDAQLAREDREARMLTGAALAPEQVPLRLGVVDAQVRIHALVLDAARAVARAHGGRYTNRARGAVDDVECAIAWLAGDGRPRYEVDAAGIVLHQPAGLDDAVPATLLAAVARSLQAADRLARETAGVVDQVRVPLRAPCPACGRRSLYVGGLAHEDARRRYVACNRVACRCSGADCGCGQRVRYGPSGDRPGRRHVWPRGEWEGVYGLAAKLGVPPMIDEKRKP